MIRALHFVKTMVGATWAMRQMSELVKQGVEVHVCGPQGPLVEAYRSLGVQVHVHDFDFPIRSPHRFVAIRRGLRSAVRSIAPDVLHSHFVGTTLSMRTALGSDFDIPRFFQVPGPLHLEHAIFRRLDIASARAMDRWIGTCRLTCDIYRNCGIDDSRVHLSYYGIDLGSFQPAAPGRLRAELNLAPSDRVIGLIAYIYPPKRYLGQRRGLKGHEDLIDAVSMLDDPALKVVFVGGAWGNAAWYENRVRDYAKKRLGTQAIFLGTRSDIPSIYADLDVVVHPSHSENVGGAAESLLLGVPTICTNVGGFPDVVIPGKTGWLVSPHAPQEIALAIVDALRDPVRSLAMAAEGRRLVRGLFDVRSTAVEVHGIYKAALS